MDVKQDGWWILLHTNAHKHSPSLPTWKFTNKKRRFCSVLLMSSKPRGTVSCMHKIIKINNVLVHCADFSSRPAFRPWATSFCPSSSPPTAAIPSAESLSCRLKKTGCIKLGGRLWGRATFPLHQNLQQKKITEKRYGHTFGCIYSTNALGFGGLGSPPTIVQQPAQENSEDEWGGGKAEEEGLTDFISFHYNCAQNISFTW